jgi:hypothetical protein
LGRRRLARLPLGPLGQDLSHRLDLLHLEPIIAPDNEGGTLLLTSEQDPINTLGVAYIGGKFWGQDLQVGRQMVDTPLINRRDNRMVPITFEGATINASLPNEQELRQAV